MEKSFIYNLLKYNLNDLSLTSEKSSNVAFRKFTDSSTRTFTQLKFKHWLFMTGNTFYQDFLIRSWQPQDRAGAAAIIRDVLAEYGLGWEAAGADRDVLEIEAYYLSTGGEFWVIEKQDQLVGTGAYYPVKRGINAVEIRKMYLLPEARGQGLGKFLLLQLEKAIASRNFQTIWIETASVLKEATRLYESNGYQPATGVETSRCDRVYVKYLLP
jgi:putative acetyltransferase